jgi:hypothetical protein
MTSCRDGRLVGPFPGQRNEMMGASYEKLSASVAIWPAIETMAFIEDSRVTADAVHDRVLTETQETVAHGIPRGVVTGVRSSLPKFAPRSDMATPPVKGRF